MRQNHFWNIELCFFHLYCPIVLSQINNSATKLELQSFCFPMSLRKKTRLCQVSCEKIKNRLRGSSPMCKGCRSAWAWGGEHLRVLFPENHSRLPIQRVNVPWLHTIPIAEQWAHKYEGDFSRNPKAFAKLAGQKTEIIIHPELRWKKCPHSWGCCLLLGLPTGTLIWSRLVCCLEKQDIRRHTISHLLHQEKVEIE